MDLYKGGILPPAMCVVVDSAGLPHLRKLHGKGGTKTIDELRTLKEYAKTPMIIKGIMTAESALKAVEAGADAIVVSNHGGRVLAETPGTAEVLPEIVEAVKGKTKILIGGGQEGIECYLDKIQSELSDTMYMCGAGKISDITSKMVRVPKIW